MDAERLPVHGVLVPHLDAAYNLARWLVNHDQDAQEIVYESYIRALKTFRGFRGSNPRAWLLTIVRDTAHNWLKKHPADLNAVPVGEAAHPEFTQLRPSESEPDEPGKLLPQALSTMPMEHREVLLLYELEHWSYDELASNLNLPIDIVIARLKSARQRLRRAIAEAQERGLLDEL